MLLKSFQHLMLHQNTTLDLSSDLSFPPSPKHLPISHSRFLCFFSDAVPITGLEASRGLYKIK